MTTGSIVLANDVSVALRALGTAIAVALASSACSGAGSIPLPSPGSSLVVHGVAVSPEKGSGPLPLCIRKGFADGPQRCAPARWPQGTPRCAVHASRATVTATLVRERGGGAHWLVQEMNGQPC